MDQWAAVKNADGSLDYVQVGDGGDEVRQCPKGHLMKLITKCPAKVTCKGCQKAEFVVSQTSAIFRCHECDFNLCM